LPDWLLSMLYTLVLIVGLNLVFIAIAAVILGTISADYFQQDSPYRSKLVRLLRNILGVLISVIGLLMLITPGPGFVMLVAGLILIENKRKTRLLEKLLARPAVYLAVARLRQRFNKPMFILGADAQQLLANHRAAHAARRRGRRARATGKKSKP